MKAILPGLAACSLLLLNACDGHQLGATTETSTTASAIAFPTANLADSSNNQAAAAALRSMATTSVDANRTILQPDGTPAAAARAAGTTIQAYESTDGSGRMHVAAWRCDVYGQYNSLSCSVPAGYVMIGGGAYADFGTGQGALLWQSSPCGTNAWCGGSKDHKYVNPHTLFVYVIGLRVDGLSTSYLQNQIYVGSTYSGASSAPKIAASLPTGYTLLSGGIFLERVSGANCLVVASIPANSSTYASNVPVGQSVRYSPGLTWGIIGKDHLYAGTAKGWAYVLGIRSSFSDPISSVPFRIASEAVASGTPNSTSGTVASPQPAAGHLVSGHGGSLNNLINRVMYRIAPWTTQGSVNSVASSKDHGMVDNSGSTWSTQIEFWKY